MKKPSEVREVILSKINFDKDLHEDWKNRIFSAIKIDYLEGSDWK